MNVEEEILSNTNLDPSVSLVTPFRQFEDEPMTGLSFETPMKAGRFTGMSRNYMIDKRPAV